MFPNACLPVDGLLDHESSNIISGLTIDEFAVEWSLGSRAEWEGVGHGHMALGTIILLLTL